LDDLFRERSKFHGYVGGELFEAFRGDTGGTVSDDAHLFTGTVLEKPFRKTFVEYPQLFAPCGVGPVGGKIFGGGGDFDSEKLPARLTFARHEAVTLGELDHFVTLIKVVEEFIIDHFLNFFVGKTELILTAGVPLAVTE
jgi:hypothetical protein